MQERMQAQSPEERERVLQRMAARDGSPTVTSPAGRRPGSADGASVPAPATTGRDPQATTIDALFGPLPVVESTGRVWMQVNDRLTPVRVRLGITDGQVTELIEGELQEGAELVTAVNTGAEARPVTGGVGAFPFMTQPIGRGGFPGGGFPGGGGGGGRR